MAVLIGSCVVGSASQGEPLKAAGITVIPHLQSQVMRYRREPDRSLGARVQLFLQNQGEQTLVLGPETRVLVGSKTPEQLLEREEWAWHDFPSAWTNQSLELPAGALTVWNWNGRRATWGVGTQTELTIDSPQKGETLLLRQTISLAQPHVWLSAVTFLGSETNPYPDSLIFHLVNEGATSVRVESCRLWLPRDNASWRALLPGPLLTNLIPFPVSGVVDAGERGGAQVRTGRLPLTYAALEIRLKDSSNNMLTVWAHQRIKRESFDISGGWVNSGVGGRNTLSFEPFLKTLARMHIDTAHIEGVPGYTDNPALYARYPLKMFNRLPPESFDKDERLAQIHAVEFLGEPQYGGGRPVAPMEVWRALAPYQSSRLPTSVTHSEERIWRWYAGLSDYAHYDAYRVSAPAPDAWSLYDRWGGERIRWGAPLETIGEMTRSLRDLNRPAPIAYWSQGAHEGWDSYGGRKRTSPTPDELRVQAWQALGARITSLYWFNLSLKSLVKFPDLIEPITRINREIRMLDFLFLEGEGTWHGRTQSSGGNASIPDWDTSVVAGPGGALCVATDLSYVADSSKKVFKFPSPRPARLVFKLPGYLRSPVEVVRVDADGVSPVTFQSTSPGILEISAICGPVSLFVVSLESGLAARLEGRRRVLLDREQAMEFDPAHNAEHLGSLRQLLKP